MYYFTKEGLEQFKKNFETIKNEYYANIKQNTYDRETNIHESGSFLYTRNELYSRYQYNKKDFQDKVNNSVIIESTDEYKNWDEKSIIRKCEIVIEFEGELETYTITGYGECVDNYMYCDADLAKCLLGHKVNDEINFRGSKIVVKEINPLRKEVGKKLELKK